MATVQFQYPQQKEQFEQYISDNSIPESRLWFDGDRVVIKDVEPITEEQFKASRDAAVSAIKVTVGNNTFDGDETAQSRMSRAIMAANTLQSPVIPLWKLADNSVVRDLPISDLEMALALSVVAMAQVWI